MKLRFQVTYDIDVVDEGVLNAAAAMLPPSDESTGSGAYDCVRALFLQSLHDPAIPGTATVNMAMQAWFGDGDGEDVIDLERLFDR